MKNLFLLMFSLFVFVVPVLITAQQQQPPLPGAPPRLPATGPSNAQQVLDRIRDIGNWLFVILFFVAILFIVWSAIQFVTAQGDATKISNARTAMLWAFVGVGFALLAIFFDDIAANLLNIGF